MSVRAIGPICADISCDIQEEVHDEALKVQLILPIRWKGISISGFYASTLFRKISQFTKPRKWSDKVPICRSNGFLTAVTAGLTSGTRLMTVKSLDEDTPLSFLAYLLVSQSNERHLRKEGDGPSTIFYFFPIILYFRFSSSILSFNFSSSPSTVSSSSWPFRAMSSSFSLSQGRKPCRRLETDSPYFPWSLTCW